MNLLVFASGKGSNFEAITKASKSGFLSASISGLICDKECPAINIAKNNKIPSSIISPKDFVNRDEYIKKLITTVKIYDPDYIILAGYMRIIPSELIDLYPMKIINIHPSLLPAFPGKDSIKRAWDSKVKTTGVSVHYVNDKLDQGAIIAQQELLIPESLEALEAKIHDLEHKMYSDAIKKITEDPYDLLIVSKCLLGDNCRYDGKNKLSDRVKTFANNFNGRVIGVCPELEAGFSVPRSEIDLVEGRAVMKEGKIDVSDQLLLASKKILDGVDKKNKIFAILKEKSPSCGLLNPEGFFTKILLETFKNNLLIITEEDL
jgi:phosphoribosylglycinamide formyltransferase 1